MVAVNETAVFILTSVRTPPLTFKSIVGCIPRRSLAFAGTTRRHEHQQDRNFRGRLGEHVGSVCHHDAEAPAGLQIDMTDTHAIVAEYFYARAASGCRKHLRGEFVGYRGTNRIVRHQGSLQSRRIRRRTT